MEYIIQGQKWKLQSHGMWSEKPDDKETLKKFKQKDLVITKEKMAKING